MEKAVEALWACIGFDARPESLVGRLPGENLFCGGGSRSTPRRLVLCSQEGGQR